VKTARANGHPAEKHLSNVKGSNAKALRTSSTSKHPQYLFKRKIPSGQKSKSFSRISLAAPRKNLKSANRKLTAELVTDVLSATVASFVVATAVAVTAVARVVAGVGVVVSVAAATPTAVATLTAAAGATALTAAATAHPTAEDTVKQKSSQ
jgi:hypothetical protein